MLQRRLIRAGPNVPTLIFTVMWDTERGQYIALDTCGSLLEAAPEVNAAIASACREADLISRTGVRIFVLVKGIDGKMHHEWTAEPPLQDHA